MEPTHEGTWYLNIANVIVGFVTLEAALSIYMLYVVESWNNSSICLKARQLQIGSPLEEVQPPRQLR